MAMSPEHDRLRKSYPWTAAGIILMSPGELVLEDDPYYWMGTTAQQLDVLATERTDLDLQDPGKLSEVALDEERSRVIFSASYLEDSTGQVRYFARSVGRYSDSVETFELTDHDALLVLADIEEAQLSYLREEWGEAAFHKPMYGTWPWWQKLSGGTTTP